MVIRMATAFTQQEESIILEKLKKAAKESAAFLGMRKTSVDQLVAAADISKGAFYKFYDSKEMLFFDVMEDMHTEVYEAAAIALRENSTSSAADRAAAAVLAACHAMEQSGMMAFVERDVPYLLRKVPKDYQQKHYHSDEVHIRELLDAAELYPAGGMELAAAAVRGLMLTISHKEEIGALYPQVLETLVYGACHELFP